jgi:sigma-B regulation protein RsbQ
MNIINRNNVRVYGKGPKTIVFAHGYGCDQAMWRRVSPSFEDEYRVVLFDYVGVGLSNANAYDPMRYSSLAGYAKDIVEICVALDLVGHSVSSMISLLAAIEIPHRISTLIMICPTPRYLNDRPDYMGGFEQADIEGLLDTIDRNQPGWASHLAGIVVNNPNQAELTHELEDSFCAMDPAIAKRFAKATFLADNRSDLVGFDKPCLILQCQNDLVAPNVVGDYLHQHLLNSDLQQMKATGHSPHMSHPLEIIELIKKYLASNVKPN